MRRRAYAALLTCLALLAGALACAAPASAAAVDEVVYVAPDADPALGSVLHVLDRSSGADAVLPGSRAAVVTPSDMRILVSRDGRHIARVARDDTDFGQRLSVYDRDTQQVMELDHVGPDAYYLGVAWLPDSQHLLVSPSAPEGAPLDLQILGLDGSRRTLPGTRGIGGFDLSPSGLQIAFTATTNGVPHVWLANLDGSSRVDLKVVGRTPLWSHDGSRLLAAVDLTAPGGEHAGILLETFTPAGTRLTRYDATYTSGWPSYDWSADRTAVLVSDGSSVREIALAADSASSTVVTTPGAGAYAAPWSTTDTTAPSLTYSPQLLLDDTSVLLGWGRLSDVVDDGLVGVRLAVAPGATPPASYAAAPRRATVLGRVFTARFTGLVAGATYSYSMWALDASGNVSDPQTGHFRLVPGTVALSAPAIASSTSAGGWIRLVYSTSAVGAAGAILKAEQPGTYLSPFYKGVQLGRSGTYYYGRGGFPETLVPGANYRICMGTRDAWGNPHWTTTCAVTQYPLDDRDRRITYSGTWSRVTATGAWMGTTSATRAGGAAAYSLLYRSGGLSAKRFTVIATTAADGGRFRVYVDGRYVTTVSTRTSSTLVRRNVWTSVALAARRTHSVRLVQEAGTGSVRLDGIAVLVQ